jgi:hypothetical protein
MAFIPFPNGARVVVEFGSGTSVKWTNGFHFTKLDFGDADLEALAGCADTYWGGALLDVVSDDCHYTQSIAYDMRTEGGTLRVNADSAGPGTQSGDMLPVQSALVLTHRTLLRGRSYRGRTYVAGLGEDKFAGGMYQGATVDTIVTMCGNFFTAAQALGWEPVVASYYHNGSPRTAAVGTLIEITQARDYLPGTQRRRSIRP